MTSLQSSVLGASSNYRFDPLPAEVRTMAERFHDAGYQTGVFTTNPWAGSSSGLEEGVDAFRDRGAERTFRSRSSVELHREFWQWRESYPGTPYWVHFQTTDVHRPNTAVAPFAGLFAPVGAERRIERDDSLMDVWWTANDALRQADSTAWVTQWDGAGVDRVAYYDARRAVYDETLAHQDEQLGQHPSRDRGRPQHLGWERRLPRRHARRARDRTTPGHPAIERFARTPRVRLAREDPRRAADP